MNIRIKSLPSCELILAVETTMFNRRYIFEGSIFHCYVSLPEFIHRFTTSLLFLGEMSYEKNPLSNRPCTG